MLGADPEPLAAEPPPETARINLIEITGICIAPQYLAEDLLRSEGFTDVQSEAHAYRQLLEDRRVKVGDKIVLGSAAAGYSMVMATGEWSGQST